ncbi:MAG: hypothetical protein JNL83_11495 [Myxococcales bacterium]|nr:hypothetical protein [Myxococcales bacterium]
MDAEIDTDLRNVRRRLVRLAIASAISAVLTYLTMQAMVSSGRGPSADPISSSSVGVLSIAIFVITTLVSYSVISRKRR